MPLNFELDVKQGFDFNKKEQKKCGYITELKIGDTVLNADTKVKNIQEAEKEFPVVAVLSFAMWNTGKTDTLRFVGQVSTDNQKTLQMLLLKEMTKTNVSFKYICYDFDSKTNQYYPCFHCLDTTIEGTLQKEGGNLELQIQDEPSREVKQPPNFTLAIGINPVKEQNLHYANSETSKLAMVYGVTVAPAA